MRLVDVYSTDKAPQILYDLLKERKDWQNISHKKMPTWSEHVRFMESRPYAHWYLVEHEGEFVGAIYISKQRELGRFLFERFTGKGLMHKAFKMLHALHPGKFIGNVSPLNRPAQKQVEDEGWKLVQYVYVLEADETPLSYHSN